MAVNNEAAEPTRTEHSLLSVARAAACLLDAMKALQASPMEYHASDPFVRICEAARATCLQVLDFEGDRARNEAVARRLYQERDLIDTLQPLFVSDD